MNRHSKVNLRRVCVKLNLCHTDAHKYTRKSRREGVQHLPVHEEIHTGCDMRLDHLILQYLLLLSSTCFASDAAMGKDLDSLNQPDQPYVKVVVFQ